LLGSAHNVKEHATLSAGASVDHGVEVGITVEHENRAADRGCCVSTCSASLVGYFTGGYFFTNLEPAMLTGFGALRNEEKASHETLRAFLNRSENL
jgi:hypothetical protein